MHVNVSWSAFRTEMEPCRYCLSPPTREQHQPTVGPMSCSWPGLSCCYFSRGRWQIRGWTGSATTFYLNITWKLFLVSKLCLNSPIEFCTANTVHLVTWLLAKKAGRDAGDLSLWVLCLLFVIETSLFTIHGSEIPRTAAEEPLRIESFPLW